MKEEQMSKIKGENAAFPTEDTEDYFHGMSMLDFFAAFALVGIIANPKKSLKLRSDFVAEAYFYAEAMVNKKKIMDRNNEI